MGHGENVACSLSLLSRSLSVLSADSLAWWKWPHSAHSSQAAHSRNSPQRGEAAAAAHASREVKWRKAIRTGTQKKNEKEKEKKENRRKKTKTTGKLANKLFVCIVYCGKRRPYIYLSVYLSHLIHIRNKFRLARRIKRWTNTHARSHAHTHTRKLLTSYPLRAANKKKKQKTKQLNREKRKYKNILQCWKY